MVQRVSCMCGRLLHDHAAMSVSSLQVLLHLYLPGTALPGVCLTAAA